MKPRAIKAAAVPDKLIAMSAPVEITAAGEADGKPTPPKFSTTVYTGIPLVVAGYDRPVVVDLASVQFSKTLIANLDHEGTQRVGHVTDKVNDGKSLILSGVFSAKTAARDEVIANAADGFPWQSSIEARPGSLQEIKAGKSVEVNGQTHEGPLYVAHNARLSGFAFVSHGADDNTTVTIAAKAASNKEKIMDPKFKAWVEQLLPGFDLEAASPEQVAGLQANYDGKAKAEPKKVIATQTTEDIIAAAEAENLRIQQINSLLAAAVEKNPANVQAYGIMAKEAIDSKHAPKDFELSLFRAGLPQGHTVKATRGSALTDKVLEAALCINGRLPNIDKHFDEKTLDAADARFKHGFGLKDVLCLAAEERGERVSRNDIRAMLRAAFPADINAAGFSTLSIPNILSNTANKFLMASFNAVEGGFREISASRSVSDFKAVNVYRLTGAFQYEKVGAGGELKHGTVSETSFTNQVDTYGKMFAITRTDIINDDLGALTQVPARLGRGSALSMNDVFWTKFLADSTPIPTNDSNLNYYADAAAGLSAASLKVLVRKFKKQIDEDSKPLGIEPKILLVAPEDEITALELMSSVSMNTGGSSSLAQVPNANVYRNRFRVVTSSYLSNTSYSGSSTTAWWLLADPMDLPYIEIAYLNGKDTPTIDTAEADFSTLGIQMRGYHDFGVSFVDYRAAQKSKGTS